MTAPTAPTQTQPVKRPSIGVRTATEADWATIQLIDEVAFGITWAEGRAEIARETLELDRTILAEVDGEPAGLASAYSMSLSLPGGRAIPVAGVTWVGVLSTHRRQGVLSALMRHQLNEVRARGEVVAALYASESLIYGRFGYGAATSAYVVTLDRAHSALRPDVPVSPDLHVRLVDAAEARPAIDHVIATARATRAGVPAMTGAFWRHFVEDLPGEREGWSARRLVLVEDADGARGYAFYRTKLDWKNEAAAGAVTVVASLCVDAATSATLWRYLTGIDLMTTVTSTGTWIEDPVLLQLADPRRATAMLVDGVFIRIVDLPGAVAARGYATHWQGVVEVRDSVIPENAGSWLITVGPDVATCTRTTAEPDLVLDVRELGAIYLGGTSLATLAAAGLVEERTAGAAAAAGRAFRAEQAPYCPIHF